MELDNREAMRKMREFREVMDEEEFSDTLDKLKTALDRLKVEVNSTTRETVDNTKSISIMKKKLAEIEAV